MRYITDGRTHKHKVRNSGEGNSEAGFSMKKESIVIRKMSVVVVVSMPCISNHTTIVKRSNGLSEQWAIAMKQGIFAFFVGPIGLRNTGHHPV